MPSKKSGASATSTEVFSESTSFDGAALAFPFLDLDPHRALFRGRPSTPPGPAAWCCTCQLKPGGPPSAKSRHPAGGYLVP
jgi:hypothetical protein